MLFNPVYCPYSPISTPSHLFFIKTATIIPHVPTSTSASAILLKCCTQHYGRNVVNHFACNMLHTTCCMQQCCTVYGGLYITYHLVTCIYTHFSFSAGKERHHVTFEDVIDGLGGARSFQLYTGANLGFFMQT